jgi:hypothetical protein
LDVVYRALAALACGVPCGAAAAQPVATNLAGTLAIPAPPAAFNPLYASNRALAANGFPRRPDALRAPEAFGVWRMAMLSVRHRIVPSLARTRMRHNPMQYSSNWSGAALTDLAVKWEPGSFKSIWAVYTVPTVVRPAGSCSGWRYSSEWAGLDGYLTSDVVQAGVEADGYCGSNGGFSASYTAWYEWYPDYSINITNFAINPNDKIVVIVAADSATEASYYVEDETTGDYVSLQSAAPPGTLYVGNSAEWITERPEVNNKLSTLADYGQETYNAYAFDTGGNMSEPGAPAWLVASQLMTMLDNNNHPISVPSLPSASQVTTAVTGSAKQ